MLALVSLDELEFVCGPLTRRLMKPLLQNEEPRSRRDFVRGLRQTITGTLKRQDRTGRSSRRNLPLQFVTSGDFLQTLVENVLRQDQDQWITETKTKVEFRFEWNVEFTFDRIRNSG